jgi:hypothetical protein
MAAADVELLPSNTEVLPRCDVRECVEGDDNLAVCTDLNGENWGENFLSELGHEEQVSGDENMIHRIKNP